METPDARPLWGRIALWLVGIALVLFPCGRAIVRAKGPTLGQVERQVREGLPLGTSRADAESWLNGHGIAFVSVEGAAKDYVMGERVADRAEVVGRRVGETIRAKVSPAFVSVVWSAVIYVHLFFDPDGKLIGYDVAPFVFAH